MKLPTCHAFTVKFINYSQDAKLTDVLCFTDCCDGSDEFEKEGLCQDRCHEEGAERKKQLLDLIDLHEMVVRPVGFSCLFRLFACLLARSWYICLLMLCFVLSVRFSWCVQGLMKVPDYVDKAERFKQGVAKRNEELTQQVRCSTAMAYTRAGVKNLRSVETAL